MSAVIEPWIVGADVDTILVFDTYISLKTQKLVWMHYSTKFSKWDHHLQDKTILRPKNLLRVVKKSNLRLHATSYPHSTWERETLRWSVISNQYKSHTPKPIAVVLLLYGIWRFQGDLKLLSQHQESASCFWPLFKPIIHEQVTTPKNNSCLPLVMSHLMVQFMFYLKFIVQS